MKMETRLQQQEQRSPSFLEVNFARPSSARKNSPKTQKKFKAVPSMQLLQSLKLYSPVEQPSTTKKLNVKAARTAELNLDEFTKPLAIKTNSRNVRKQLWSVSKCDNKVPIEKGDKARRGTIMKPGSYRKTVYSRPSLTNSKKVSLIQQSNDDTLPLMDMDQFTVTKIKRTLFPSEQVNQRKTVSHISVLNKKPLLTKKLTKPKIVLTPVEKICKKSNEKTTSSNNNTINSSKKTKILVKDKRDEVIEVLVKKVTVLEDKLKAMDDIKKLLKTVCERLDIEMPESLTPKTNKKITKTIINQRTNEDNNSAKFEEITFKLSPFISKLSISEKLHPSKVIVAPEKVEKLPENKTPKKHSPNKQNIPESTMKLKKTWITQFEQLENKLLNNSNVSVNLNSSPDESPVPILQLNDIVNHQNIITNLKIIKSQSTSNLADLNQQKKSLFKSKETDLLTESICVYNELRDEMKFLSTPVNNKTMNFITPSVQGNEKKLISRRVQEQLLRLNDC